MVQKYTHHLPMLPSPNGQFVLASGYEALERCLTLVLTTAAE